MQLIKIPSPVNYLKKYLERISQQQLISPVFQFSPFAVSPSVPAAEYSNVVEGAERGEGGQIEEGFREGGIGEMGLREKERAESGG